MMRLLGRRLRTWRAGAEFRVAEDIRFSQVPRTIELASDAFENGAGMPQSKASPPLHWSGVPPHTQRLVLLVEDIDAPLYLSLIHI